MQGLQELPDRQLSVPVWQQHQQFSQHMQLLVCQPPALGPSRGALQPGCPVCLKEYTNVDNLKLFFKLK